MEDLVRDFRFALRRLWKAPLFTAIAIASLAIGIGANTAIFTMVNAIMLRELPLEEPDELVEVYRSVAGFSHATFSHLDSEDFERDMAHIYSGVASTRLALVQMDVDVGVETLPAELVTGDYFTLLGVPAALGRTLLEEDDISPGGHPVVVLDHGFWQRRYAGDPNIIGEEIRLNGRAYEIVGVADRLYTGNLRGMTPAFYAPMAMSGQLQPSDSDYLNSRGNQSSFVKARLLPGVTLAQAQAAADQFAERFRTEFPTFWQADNVVTLVPVSDVIMNPMVDRFIKPAVGMMLTVVGLVLLIACANLGGFLLAQAADRRKEIAVRLAMGARRSTLIRQLLTESMLLSLLGGVAGILLATVLLRALVAADLPLPFPITLDLSLDRTVLGFALLVTALAGVLFGLAPALQASNPDVTPTLKDEGTGGGRPRRMTLRGALVAAQAGLSLVLLVGAGLFLRSLQARLDVDPGFGYEPAGIVSLQTPPDRYSPEESRVFMRNYVKEVGRLPGVTAVGTTFDLHLSSFNNSSMGVVVDGVDPPPGQDYHLVEWAAVDAGFFDAVGVSILQGRGFDETDVPESAPVAVISAAMAERFWPGEDPLGLTFRRNETDYTIVGIARDAKVRSLGEVPRPFVYRPYEQSFSSSMTVIASTQGDAERAALDMLALARQLDPEILIFEQKTMERHLAVMMLGARLAAIVVSGFGLIALLLASLGLYGVVSYAVSTRSREVGIRMSLGADPGSVVRLLMRGGLRLVVVGASIGLVLAFLAARLLSSLLYGIEATDPVAFLAVPVLLGTVALLAAYLPARRASSISPVSALKSD